MPQSQADLTKFRWKRVNTIVNHTAAPTNGTASTSGTAPDFRLSPFTVSKMPTTGIGLMLQSPQLNPATAVAAGFTVRVWLRDPATKRWASFDDVSIAYQQLFVTFDIDAGELFFQFVAAGTAVDGNIDIGVAEQ